MANIRGTKNKLTKHQKNGKLTKYQTSRENEQSFCDDTDPEGEQIKDLLQKLPKLDNIFKVHRKIGEGTFSSVYLGSLHQHESLPDSQKRWFAIKHLVPTAHPARVEHELKCLQEMGGKHNVIGVELCLRHLDSIVFVMPYIPHRKFSEYVGDMDSEEVARYMHALLVALRHVHSFGVIHRDVKPSNFLYDRERRRYLLVDFGLAQRVEAAPPDPPPPHTPPPAHTPLAAKRTREEDVEVSPEAKRMALDLSVRAATAPTPVPAPTPAPAHAPRYDTLKHHITKSVGGAGVGCACANVAGVCAGCLRRAGARAPRAGTQGFRPPEVLLKSPRQGTGVDVWASGVVLAALLTGRYPLLRAADDVSALAELVDLLGSAALQRVAAALGRRLVLSASRNGICLRKLARHLREPAAAAGAGGAACGGCGLGAARCVCLRAGGGGGVAEGEAVAGFPASAFALASRLLDPDPRTRISAADALRHPYLRHLPH